MPAAMTTLLERTGDVNAQAPPGVVNARPVLWLAVPILLLAFGLRVFRLGDPGIWWDEGLAFWAVKKSLIDVTLWTAGDVHPPIFFWLLWTQVRLAGDSEFSARFVDVVAGVLTVAVVFPFGKLLSGAKLAAIAALLLALARFPIWWSQELRMYAPATFFAFAASYFALRALKSRPRWWSGYVVSAAATLWSLYIGAAVLIAHNIAFGASLLVDRTWRRFALWCAAQLAVAALFVPWLLIANGRMQTWSTSEPVEASLFVRLFAVVLTTGISTEIDRYWPWVAGGLAGLAFLTILSFVITRPSQSAKSTLGWLLALLLVAVPAGLVFYATQPRGLFYSPRLEVRYFLLSAPGFAVLAAGGIYSVLRLARPIGGLVLLVVSALLFWSTYDYLDVRHRIDEYGSIVKVLDAYSKPGDAVFLVSGDRSVIFDYHLAKSVANALQVFPLPYTVPATDLSAAGDAGPIAERFDRVWLVSAEAHLQDPAKRIRAWLDANRRVALEVPIGHNGVTLFDRTGTPAAVQKVAPDHPLSLSLGGGRELLGFDVPADRFFPQEIGHFAIYWKTGSAPGPIAVRLVDAEGVTLEEWVFTDEGAVPGSVVRKQGEMQVHTYTPAGNYALMLDSGAIDEKLASIQIERTEPIPGLQAGGPRNTVNADFGDSLRLLGYDLGVRGRPIQAGDTLRPGDEISLSLYWMPLKRLDRSWVAFSHLIGGTLNPVSNNPVWGQDDGFPLKNELPTQQWRPGVAVRDERLIRIQESAPAAEYEIEVGFYWQQTGERLTTADGTGRALLQKIKVIQ